MNTSFLEVWFQEAHVGCPFVRICVRRIFPVVRLVTRPIHSRVLVMLKGSDIKELNVLEYAQPSRAVGLDDPAIISAVVGGRKPYSW